jgi:hypothetical protein
MTERHMEDLHASRLLVPLWRYRRSSRQIHRALARADFLAHQLARFAPEGRLALLDAQQRGTLSCALDERRIPLSRRRREQDHLVWLTSEYLYSHHQLSILAYVEPGLRGLHRNRSGKLRVDVNKRWLSFAVRRSRELSELAIGLSVLEGAYWSGITGRLSLPGRPGSTSTTDGATISIRMTCCLTSASMSALAKSQTLRTTCSGTLTRSTPSATGWI